MKKGTKRRERKGRAAGKRYGFATPSRALLTLLSDPVRPVEPSVRNDLLLEAESAMDAIRRDAQPQKDHWHSLAQAVEVSRELMRMGALPKENAYADVNAACGALVAVAERRARTGAIRMSGPDQYALESMLDWYSAALRDLPARVIAEATAAVAARNGRVQAGHTYQGKQVVAI